MRNINEIMDDIKSATEELKCDENPLSELLQETNELICKLLSISGLKLYKAYVKNEDTKQEYEYYTLATSEEKADHQINDFFDEKFYHKTTRNNEIIGELDMYSYCLEEININIDLKHIEEFKIEPLEENEY